VRRHDRSDDGLIGHSQCFLEVLDRVSELARLDRPALVVGERGTGKEQIASRLHYLSPRWDRPLVKLNCAALAESLLETELFGHEAGAFTGAARRHSGRFELAHEGSLFLDEVSSSSQRVQEKILRVIEYGEFERVGGRETVKTDVRIIAAANLDLPSLAQRGEFRLDLLDRLAFDVITLPPLRARQADILLLAEHFAQRMTSELGREVFVGFGELAREQMLSYLWPGNIRELKNVVERGVYRMPDPDEELADLQFDPFQSPYRPGIVAAVATADSPSAAAPAETSTLPPKIKAVASSVTTEPRSLPLPERVKRMEIQAVEQALAACRFNQRKAAELLGLSYHQLRGYLRKYKLSGVEAGLDSKR